MITTITSSSINNIKIIIMLNCWYKFFNIIYIIKNVFVITNLDTCMYIYENKAC